MSNEIEQLPVYKIFIDDSDETNIDFISLVENPAIMVKGLIFSQQKQEDIKIDNKYKLQFNEEKQIIAGPVLIPNQKIYRYDEDLGEYYCLFEPETIVKMVEKFNRLNKSEQLNVEHSSEIAPAYILGNWIIEDTQFDKSRMYGFEDLPIGTWFCEVKITDKEFWNKQVKEKGRNGFSVEGLMGLSLSQMEKFDVIKGIIPNSSNVSEYKYNTNNNTLELEFHSGDRYKYYNVDWNDYESIIIGDGTCITEGRNEFGSWYEGKSPSVGASVYQILVEKNVRYEKMSEQTDININNKTNLNFENKMEKKIKRIKFSEYKTTDGVVLKIEGDLEVGSPVFLVLEDGTLEQVETGEYTLVEGIIKVDDNGMISEVTMLEPVMEEMETKVEEEIKVEEPSKVQKLELIPEEVMVIVNPIFEEMRTIIAELQTRVEQLEGNKPVATEEVMSNKFSDMSFRLTNVKNILNS